jgi:hypothetical protein
MGMPVLKIIAFLEFKQKLTFSKGLNPYASRSQYISWQKNAQLG